MAKHASILGTVGRTPVVKINKLAPKHVELYVKVEAFNPMGSVKDRLALGVIEDAERSGKLRPGQTVIEATSGNTGIGLAMVCAVKGYPLVVTMAENFSVERRKLMRFLGAKVVLTPAALKGTGMLAKAVELAQAHDWFLCRQFENEANADMHSRTTAQEILADFAGDRLDYFVTGYGTGGTLKGVGRVLRKERPDTKVIVCEPDNSQVLAGGQPSEFSSSPDAGLESRLHSEAHRRCRQHGIDRSDHADQRQRCAQVVARARAEGGDLRWHHGGRHLRRCAQDLRVGSRRHEGAVHAAGHRRTLSHHSALRRHSGRHDGG
jgi:cysteine synthase